MKARQNAFLFALLLTTIAIALAGWARHLTTTLEAVSFVSGALCVWLTVRQSTWNFPIGLLNVATFSVVFFENKLYADAGLQLIYFVLTLLGWYLWVFGGENKTKLKVSRATTRELAIVAATVAVLTFGLWRILSHWGGSASFWDALTASISLGAQWLLNRKKLESWWLWIIVDIIYVPLYLYKALYLTALLYLIFVCMAVVGYREWKNK